MSSSPPPQSLSCTMCVRWVMAPSAAMERQAFRSVHWGAEPSRRLREAFPRRPCADRVSWHHPVPIVWILAVGLLLAAFPPAGMVLLVIAGFVTTRRSRPPAFPLVFLALQLLNARLEAFTTRPPSARCALLGTTVQRAARRCRAPRDGSWRRQGKRSWQPVICARGEHRLVRMQLPALPLVCSAPSASTRGRMVPPRAPRALQGSTPPLDPQPV